LDSLRQALAIRATKIVTMRLLFSLALLQLSISSFGQTPTKQANISFDSLLRAKENFGQTPTRQVNIDFDSLMKAKEKEIVGKPFPTFAVANEQGKINNDSLKGKVVLINFWFEGCHPCVAEFGALNELAQKLRENKNFKFISFTWDDSETIKKVQEKYQLQYEVFQASDRECHRLNQESAYPTIIILDKRGIIKYWDMGGSSDPILAREFIMTALLPKIQQEL
jgi:thiol-disulfide isomerase/thioredoxin